MQFIYSIIILFFGISIGWGCNLSNLDKDLAQICQHSSMASRWTQKPEFQSWREKSYRFIFFGKDQNQELERGLKDALKQFLEGQPADVLNKPFDDFKTRFPPGEGTKEFYFLISVLLDDPQFAHYETIEAVKEIFKKHFMSFFPHPLPEE